MYKNQLNRKPNRLKGYDYSQDGYYFITTCIRDRLEYFGEIKDGEMLLNEYGKIVQQCWCDLINHYWNCELDEFVVMPNHLHGIVIINNHNFVGIDFKSVPTGMKQKQYSLSNIIQGFKIFSSRKINEQNPKILSRWQRSFYDHIIRNEESLYKIREYIRNNPLRWDLDRNNPESLFI